MVHHIENGAFRLIAPILSLNPSGPGSHVSCDHFQIGKSKYVYVANEV